MVKRVAIWAAVSSLPQAKKISLDDQLTAGRNHAQRHGAQIVAELVVPGESRNIVLFEDACQRIEAYDELRALIDSKAIDALIYLDPSRLGRTAALVLTVAELCTRASILLYETDNPPSTLEFTPPDYDALLVRAIKATGAQNEVRKISDKHRKGMIGRVMSGLFPGRPNFGYVEIFNAAGELDRYDIDPKRINTVLKIIQLYLEKGWGTRVIGDYLNRNEEDYGLSPDGGLWSYNTIISILRNAWRYAGYAELNRRKNRRNPSGRPYVRAKGNWPAIIDERTAQRVMDELESRGKSRRSISNTYRFSRMVFCAVCGDPMTVGPTINKYRRKSDGIIAETKRVYHRCPGGHSRTSEPRIHAFLADLIQKLQDKAHRDQMVALVDTGMTTNAFDEIERHQKQIEHAQAGLKKADDDHYVHGRLDPDRHNAIVHAANKVIMDAQAEITKLQDKLREVEHASNLAQRLDEVQEHGIAHLNDPDVRAANAWLHKHFRIWVTFSDITDVEIF